VRSNDPTLILLIQNLLIQLVERANREDYGDRKFGEVGVTLFLPGRLGEGIRRRGNGEAPPDLTSAIEREHM